MPGDGMIHRFLVGDVQVCSGHRRQVVVGQDRLQIVAQHATGSGEEDASHQSSRFPDAFRVLRGL
jgi:hypothetical protein